MQKGPVLSESNESKGSAQLVLVLMAVVIIAGGLYAYLSTRSVNVLPIPQQNPVKQSAFNEYASAELGLKFKYPKDLTVKSDSEEEFNQRGTGANSKTVNGDFRKNFQGYVGYEPGKFLGAISVLDKDNDFEKSPFTVWVFNNDNNLTIDAWFQNYWYYPFLWGVFDYTSKSHVAPDSEATISGQLAKSKVVAYQPGKPKFVYVSDNGKMYLFRLIGEDGEKILSSFGFLN